MEETIYHTEWSRSGKNAPLIKETFHIGTPEGELHNDDASAEREYFARHLLRETWYQRGKICNPTGPAIKNYNKWYHHSDKYDGQLRSAEWHEGGKCYRIDYYEGDINREYLDKTIYCVDGDPHKPHRIGGPAVIEYLNNGNAVEEQWYVNGVLHNDNAPAEIAYHHYNGLVVTEAWWKRGTLHRVDGPAHIEYNGDHSLSLVKWFCDDEIHREDGPAEISYDNHGCVMNELWVNHGLIHREGAPAELSYERGKLIAAQYWEKHERVSQGDVPSQISYHEDGAVYTQKWFNEHGQYHRLNGPAYIVYYDNGIMTYMKHYIDDELHCTNGPAQEHWDENGIKEREIWSIKGEEHRTDGPSESKWEDGKLRFENYYVHDEPHRTNGPAVILYEKNGEIEDGDWFIKGNEVDVATIISILTEISEADAVEIKMIYG